MDISDSRPTLLPVDLVALAPGTRARACLVVEKDAVFNTLVQDQFLLSEGIVLITSMGFPTWAARDAVALLSRAGVPTFALTDCNAAGLHIWQSYAKHAPQVRWLGIRPSDVERYKTLARTEAIAGVPNTPNDVVMLQNIQKKVEAALERRGADMAFLQALLKEIRLLITSGRKYEVELFSGRDLRLLLVVKLERGCWI